jgi:hypothetical protein
MKGMSLRAVVALLLAGSAAFVAVRARERRRALGPGTMENVPLGGSAGEGASRDD